MRLPRNVTIQRKLRWIILLTTSASLTLASVAFISYDLFQVRQTMVNDLRTLAEILGNLNSGTLTFDDPTRAKEYLGALGNRKNIVAAYILRKNQIFAAYERPGADYHLAAIPPPADTFQFSHDKLEVEQRIIWNGDFLGTVLLVADLTEMAARVKQYLVTALLAVVVSMLLALFLSSKLQKLISKPIIDLASITKVVSRDKNYSIRALKETEDELGDLVAGFNEMLGQIQTRDAALQKARDELEKRVEERTHELQLEIAERKQAVEQLKSFTERLERSNRELQDFAYVASHDLQEPLRKVQAFGDRLKLRHGAQLGADGNDFLERMISAARRMQNLINDLLAFSRISTQGNPFEQVDLGKVVREVISDLEVPIQQTNARVTVDSLPVIEADPSQMRQLFQNLIGNALKFNRPDVPPLVNIAARIFPLNAAPLPDGPRSDQVCEISIQDNGIGFDEKYLDRIFAVFQRLHNRAAYEGTGIGLAICRKITERHHGAITARSKIGEGAMFIVTLPFKQSKE